MRIDALRPPPEPEPAASISIDPEVARGAYSNLAIVHHTETEFVVDFVIIDPSGDRGQVLSRMLLNPRQAKRFAATLQAHVETYEGKFGALPDEPTLPAEPVGA
ncbi:MAG: DUF3467 domain-containing protein [Myxococcota bacterium]